MEKRGIERKGIDIDIHTSMYIPLFDGMDRWIDKIGQDRIRQDYLDSSKQLDHSYMIYVYIGDISDNANHLGG